MSGTNARLGDLVTFLSGFAFKSQAFNSDGDGLPLVRIRDVVAGRSNTFYSGPFDTRFLVEDGDYLIGMDGEFNLARWHGGRALLNQRVCKVDKVSPVLDRHYLARFLPKALKAIEDETPFVTVKHLSVKDLNHVTIPVPPLGEQRRIAEVLDRADDLRAKRREALTHLDDLTQSIFLDMFGNPAVNPMGLPRMPLGELIVLGPQNGLYKPSSEYGEGTPIVRIDAFYGGVMTGLAKLKRLRTDQAEIERYGLTERDILINRVNSLEYLGKSAVVPRLEEPTVFESNMVRLRLDPSRAEANYMIHLLQSGHIKSQIRAAAKNAVNQSSINQADVKALDIILPPLAAQREFVRRADAVQQHRRRLRAGLAELDALFASLQDRAFRGLL
ncbi:hypothetical protein FXF50_16925 [Micromonospora sp. AP08]|uniref:restriction endonuclease subunit S n=1 Tax=Micromonospora sp. AP08 TaxID=2604467 RepID=UPI0011D8262A|nr:restriction endonuclease subunit S [Micromonospora sp. AP08]TYB36726.1 hypothetical protein FXF50_16925 [Micromonospora sp. AP08]